MKQTLGEAAHSFAESRSSGSAFPAYYQGFIAGAEWQAKQSPWISVKERNPSTGKEVFIYHNGKCFVGYLSYFMCNYWWTKISMLDTEDELVDDEDYWMDKAELPK